MSFDAFLIFENPGSGGIAITGETMDEDMKKKKAFEIKQFSFGVTNTVNIGSQSGGAGAGKATFEDFSVQKNTDSGSPGLFRTCCSGGHYGDVTLILRRSGGDRSKSGTPFLTFKFKLVAVKSVNWEGSDGDDVPGETVVFEYGALKVEYVPQDQTGKSGKMIEQEWSRVKNTASLTV